MDLIIDEHGGGLVTGPDAVGQLKGEPSVGGGLARFDADVLRDALHDHGGVLEITGKAFAYPDHILALRFGRKKGIEACHPVNLAEGKVEIACDPGEGRFREGTVGPLSLLEEVEELLSRSIVGHFAGGLGLLLGGRGAFSLFYPFRPHKGARRTVFDADTAVLADLFVEGDVEIDDHLGTKAPIGHAIDVLAGNLLASPDTFSTENAAGHIPEHVGAYILYTVETGSFDMKPRGTYLQVGGELVEGAFPGLSVCHTGPRMARKEEFYCCLARL